MKAPAGSIENVRVAKVCIRLFMSLIFNLSVVSHPMFAALHGYATHRSLRKKYTYRFSHAEISRQ